MRTDRQRQGRWVRVWWVAGWFAWGASACNALTGVNDLALRSEVPEVSEVSGAVEPSTQTTDATPVSDCDFVAGSGCNTPEVCRFDRATQRGSCGPLPATPVGEYAACEQDGDCAAGFACVDGVCSKLCESAGDCGWANARCLSVAGQAFSHCSRNCDLVSPISPRGGLQACGSATRCEFVADAAPGDGYTQCVPVLAMSFEGGACDADADCPVGYACPNERCVSICDASNPCAGNQVCGAQQALAGQLVGTCCRVPAGQTCDVLTGCGCENGQACDYNPGRSGTFCRAVDAAPAAPYGACDSDTACPALYTCAVGVCHRACNTGADCGSEGVQCVPLTDEDGLPIAGHGACARRCDPLSPQQPRTSFQGCGADLGCQLFSGIGTSSGGDFFTCAAPGSGLQGTSCAGDTDCAVGFACFSGQCQRWCDRTATTCASGLTCGGVGEVDGVELGSCCLVPPGQACDWVSGCGCAVGESCTLNSGDFRQCRAVSFPAPALPYGACSEDADCPAAHHCFAGACAKQCAVASDCGWDNAICYTLLAADGSPLNGTGLCSRNCDLLSPAAPAAGFQSCGAGLTCDVFSDPSGTFSDCNVAGTGTNGSACEGAFDCSVGFGCQSNICRRFCAVGAANTCPNGTSCVAVGGLPVIGGRTSGACLPANG